MIEMNTDKTQTVDCSSYGKSEPWTICVKAPSKKKSAEESQAELADSAVPEGWLPELWHNPFTRALGVPPTWLQHHDALVMAPEHSKTERQLCHTQRRYCVLRLFDAVIPISNQVDLAERIGMVIRQGYKARDPARGGHWPALKASAAAIQQLVSGASLSEVEPSMPSLAHGHPPGFALIGDPGTGKTTTTLRTLAGIPQVVEQSLPYAVIKQVVWLKVECPAKGGRKQLCTALLTALDKVLGTRYAERFGAERKRMSPDSMMLFVEHLVTLHAIGLIVIDELQHARQSSEGVKPLVNFLVTLVNMLGVPIVLIGTNEARSIVDGAFREARRATGLGQPNWFRMSRGLEWDDWLKQLWPYQWTAVPSPLTPEISEAIYDESQGIMDIAVKLYLLVQMRVISRGEVYETPEFIDEQMIRSVAKDEFQLIRPMIIALRENRQDLLEKWADLEPLHHHIELLLSQATGRSMRDIQHLRDLNQRIANAEADANNADWLSLKASLVQRGYAPKVVERVVSQASCTVAVGDMFGMVQEVTSLLAAEAAPRPEKVRRPALDRKRKDKHPDEMCTIASMSEDPVAALAEVGIVATPQQILAA